MPAKFVVFLDKASKFRFNLKATNGEIIASSESYPDKKSAMKGIASIQKNAPVAVIDDTTVQKDVKPKAAAKTAKTAAKTTKAVKTPKAATKTAKVAKVK